MEADTSTRSTIDGHVDLIYEMMGRYPNVPLPNLTDCAVTLSGMREANVRLIVAALYCADSHNGPGSAAPHLQSLMDYARTYFTEMVRVDSCGDLQRCLADGSPPGYLLLLENSDALVDLDLRGVKDAGIRIAGLTHAGSNRLGDGNGVIRPRGLSAAGKRLVKDLEAQGFAIDVAHLADPGFADLVRIFDGPIVSSHTGFRFFYDTPRNLTREQMDVLFARGGIVGITVNPEMLSATGTAGIDEVFRHVDWVAQKVGPDHVAIGSDFCGFDHPNTDIGAISRLPLIAEMLRERGYPADAVDSIMGGNWHRFYRSLLAG
jgi:membrane dipeptidase